MTDIPSLTDLPSTPGAPPVPETHISLKQKQLLYTIPVLLILVVGMGVIILSLSKNQDVRNRASNTGPTLALAPATVTSTVGSAFSLGATLNTNSDSVSAAQLQLTYDPTAVQILSFTAGTGLPTALVPETHTNGTIAVTLGSPVTTPFVGAGIIGMWQVKLLAAKPSSISFTSATEVASIGKTTNSLVSTSGTTIIVAGSTPTPTTAQNAPTATPTPMPAKQPASIPTPSPTPVLVLHVLYPTPSPTAPPPVTTPMTGFARIGSTQPAAAQLPVVIPSPTSLPTPVIPQNQQKPTFLEQIFISLGSFFVKLFGK